MPVISDAQRTALGGDALIAVRPAADVQTSLTLVNFTLPVDTFAHTRADAVVQLTAAQADGQALPGGLAFDPKTGAFNGKPPPGIQGTLAIRVVARDQAGREAVATVKIQIGEKAAAPAPVERHGGLLVPTDKVIKLTETRQGRLAFTRQLQLAGRNAATLHNAALAARVARS